MNISPCISKPSSFLSVEDFTIGPYLKAKEYYDLFIEIVWFSEAHITEKALKGIKHLSLGILFSIPLVNIIATIGFAILSKSYEPTVYKNGLECSLEKEAAPKSESDALQRPLLSSLLQNIQESSHLDLDNVSQKIRESFLFLTELSSQLDLNHYSLSLSHAYIFHSIHSHLTRLSKFFGEQGVEQELWFKFLESLESARFVYPNHTLHALDLNKERKIYNHPTIRYQLELTTPKSLDRKELAEVASIEMESFTVPLSSRCIREFVQSPRSKIILAKHESAVVGVLMYKDGTITSLARRADAVMGVGLALFKKLKEELAQTPPKSLELQVRASNAAAINLYEQVGFSFRETLPNYYSYPREDAWLMSCESLAV